MLARDGRHMLGSMESGLLGRNQKSLLEKAPERGPVELTSDVNGEK